MKTEHRKGFLSAATVMRYDKSDGVRHFRLGGKGKQTAQFESRGSQLFPHHVPRRLVVTHADEFGVAEVPEGWLRESAAASARPKADIKAALLFAILSPL